MAFDVEGYLLQFTVYWAPLLPPSRQGEKLFDDPVEVKCRWQDSGESVTDKHGREVLSRAKLYVDREIDPEGVMRKGKLEDLDSAADPFLNKNPNAWEVVRSENIPDSENETILHKVYL